MKLQRKTIITLILAVVLLAFATIITISLMQHPNNAPSRSPETLSFSALLPNGKTQATVKGQMIITPGGEQTYQFNDSIDGKAISVSEQHLPANFSSANSADALKKFAEGFNATKTLTVNSTTVYTGTSAQGPQWAIFARNDLLVIIRSTDTISDASWKQYITELK